MTLPPRPLPPAPGHRTRRVYVGYTTHQCLKPHHPHLHTGALALALSRACVPAVCRGVWRAARVPVNAIPTRTRHLGALDSPPNNAHTFSSARPCGRTRTAPTPVRATNNAHTFSGARPCGRIRTTPTPARATSRRLHSSQMYIKNAHTLAGARPVAAHDDTALHPHRQESSNTRTLTLSFVPCRHTSYSLLIH